MRKCHLPKNPTSLRPSRVTVVEASTGLVVAKLEAPNVYELGFSPAGTFVITWQRPSKDENGDAVKNLVVWSLKQAREGDAAQSIIGRFVQKSQTGWNLQYTRDENHCARTVNNEVQFFKSDDLTSTWHRLRIEGVRDFALSPGTTNAIAVFVPEKKGQPASVKIFTFPDAASPVSQKTFFKGDKVQLKWNQQGTSLIVLAQTEVDKSGKSYYGETTLYLLSANGGFDSRIDLDKEGPIHDVTWSPSSNEFGVVYGYMPAKTTLFNTKAAATHSFALGPRNTITFSPSGQLVLVAGFGNLAGHIDIYDLEKDYSKVCTIQASNSSVCEWSPDGMYILTATTSPRLRVDNGVKVWHAGGGLVYHTDMHELYHVTWRPCSPAEQHFPEPLHPVPPPHASALAALGAVKTPSKPAGAYRPPGARGTSTPLAFMREDQGGAAYVRGESSPFGGGVNGFGKPRRREVPGAAAASTDSVPGATGAAVDGDENLSKAALKNKRKREAKKTKETTGGAEPKDANLAIRDAPRPSTDRKITDSTGKDQPRTTMRPPPGLARPDGADNPGPAPAPAPAAPPTEAANITSPTSGGPTTPHEKKIRALTKKLRAIDDLKMRAAGGEALEGTQIKKMETEDAVRKELDGLGWVET